MTNEEQFTKIIEKNTKHLENAKEHTQYKIGYIKSYISKWLKVAERYNQNNVNFIDCMCNAGIYKNNILCTCTEVVKLFVESAKQFPHKQFNVFLNDYNENRIKILEEVIIVLNAEKLANLNIYYDTCDVVQYLNNFPKYDNKLKNALTILYVDPYNFGIDNLLNSTLNFVDRYYCELIYNFFSSDIRRNISNDTAINKSQSILKELKGVIEEFDVNEFDVLDAMVKVQESYKKTRNIKYTFAYKFKVVKTNVELYYILYFTPNIRGLELLKESIWDVFGGESSFSKYFVKYKDLPTLFDQETMLVESYANELVSILKEKYNGLEVSYTEIETYVLENSFLKSTHIIKHIIKPLIKMNILTKENLKGSRNYKEDFYIFS